MSSQNDVNDGIHISNIDLTVIIDVANQVRFSRENHVDDGIHVGDVHLIVAIHVTINSGIGTDAHQCQCQTKYPNKSLHFSLILFRIPK